MTSRHDSPRASSGLFSVWLWWGALAAVFYLVFHALAGSGVPTELPESLRAAMKKIAPADTWQAIGQAAEYVVPAVCAAFAIVFSLLALMRQRQTAGRSGDAPGALGEMDSREFDGLLVDAFKLQGYQLVSTGGAIDMVLRKDHATCLVQSKQWRLAKAGIKPLQELFSIMGARDAASGIAVTSGRFGRDAVSYATTHAITLVEGAALLGMIRRAQTARDRSAMPALDLPPPIPRRPAFVVTASSAADLIPVAEVLPAQDEDDDEDGPVFAPLLPPTPAPSLAAVPTRAPKAEAARTSAATRGAISAKPCPKCGGLMKMRTVRSGPKQGEAVWSCVDYPSCKGMRRVRTA